ncbi:alpha-L-fucosidase [Pedobacter insulae]|uniref:alpha-L-fucosidase n=1 Tax=Pedobacter insulae TaxID=414048 RepID=A0A1I2ZR86_9SPHI|nr:alpha-L-fucosidase [Pedobacter insulae]SFH40264.1 alpha-L-fucosidase [Pedobacter insulae]
MMIKRVLLLYLVFLSAFSAAAQNYTPSTANLEARKWFNDARFGLFIHWGPFSIPGSGEWVMNNRKITVNNYTRLQDFFNPTAFDAAHYVTMAKNAGMKYITLITRHHDGFSMWDTKHSDFNITNTPYKKDIVKMMADECHKQGIKLFLYYSLLDWTREDYPHETGRTGQHSGRKGKSDYASYLQFMKNQLTELLTNYGEIAGIWFDGHWDQTAPEGEKDRNSRIDWKYDEIYSLIHQLQPQCLIGNNHHLTPFAGEDFQMFEKDLPGENKSGLSFQKASDKLPLETCETINGSWGFSLTDTTYKSNKQLIEYLVKAASLGTNLLLNIGPMPNGKVQPEFEERLQAMGSWLKTYGESIYGTEAGYLKPQEWGSMTKKGNKIFVHVLNANTNQIVLPQFLHKKIKKAYLLKDNSSIQTKLSKNELIITLNSDEQELDRVVVLEV